MLESTTVQITFQGVPDIAYFPTVDSDTNDFSFTVSSTFGTFVFEAHWVNELWKLYVTLPDLTVREATVWPLVFTWREHGDYSLLFYPPVYASVSHDDISGMPMRIFKR